MFKMIRYPIIWDCLKTARFGAMIFQHKPKQAPLCRVALFDKTFPATPSSNQSQSFARLTVSLAKYTFNFLFLVKLSFAIFIEFIYFGMWKIYDCVE